jgi:hypothetical protein
VLGDADVEAGGGCPGASVRIVEFALCAFVAEAVEAANDEDSAIREQGRGVLRSRYKHAAGGRPGTSCRIKDLGSGDRIPIASYAAGDKDAAVEQGDSGRVGASEIEGSGGRPTGRTLGKLGLTHG